MLANIVDLTLKFPQIKSHGETLLSQERDRLLDLMTQVRQTGSVAPALYNVQEKLVEKKSGKVYRYAVLRHRDLKDRSLGKWHSESHQDWAARIARREAIREIEFRLERIESLIERDERFPIDFKALERGSQNGRCN